MFTSLPLFMAMDGMSPRPNYQQVADKLRTRYSEQTLYLVAYHLAKLADTDLDAFEAEVNGPASDPTVDRVLTDMHYWLQHT